MPWVHKLKLWDSVQEVFLDTKLDCFMYKLTLYFCMKQSSRVILSTIEIICKKAHHLIAWDLNVYPIIPTSNQWNMFCIKRFLSQVKMKYEKCAIDQSFNFQLFCKNATVALILFCISTYLILFQSNLPTRLCLMHIEVN